MTTLTEGMKTHISEIHRAQFLLSGHNVFQKRTYWAHTADQHNVFDAKVAEAARQMKNWLGYPKKEIQPTFGDTLIAYLTGKKKLTPAMKLRRVARGFAKGPLIQPKKKYFSPIVPGHKWTFLGGPGAGTHSFTAPPNNWQSDNARDYGVPVGTPLQAVAAGKIGSRIGPISADGGRFAGLRFYLECDDGNQFYYAHCSSVAVTSGERVKAGQVVAKSGSASGVAHLHIGEMHGDPMNDLP